MRSGPLGVGRLQALRTGIKMETVTAAPARPVPRLDTQVTLIPAATPQVRRLRRRERGAALGGRPRRQSWLVSFALAGVCVYGGDAGKCTCCGNSTRRDPEGAAAVPSHIPAGHSPDSPPRCSPLRRCSRDSSSQGRTRCGLAPVFSTHPPSETPSELSL